MRVMVFGAIHPKPSRVAVCVTTLLMAWLGSGALLNRAVASPASPIRVEPEVPVTAMNESVKPSNNSPLIVADPDDPRFVVIANRLDAPDFSCALQVSGDAGRTWLPADPVPRLPNGAEKCYAPEAAFDGDGRLYYLFVGLAGTGNRPMGVFLTSSEDRGRTFAPPRRVLGPLNFAARMAIDTTEGDRGRIHLVWLRATSDPALGGFGPPPNPILTAHSDDGGRTFTKPLQVSDPSRDRVVAPALAVGPDHTVHVAYYDLQRDAPDYQGLEGPVWEGTWSLVLSTSNDGGRRFSSGKVVDDRIAPPERVMLIFTMAPPSLAVRGDRICLAWTDARYGDADAVVRCSPDGGTRWEKLRRLNDDPVGNGHRQFMPRLAWSPQGRLDAVFLDRRDDPRNTFNYVYYTFSEDGGRQFSDNLRITRKGSNSRIGQRYVGPRAAGQVEFGARLGLLAQRSWAIAAWPDTRNSRPGTGQDLFAARVTLEPPRSDAGWLRRFRTPALSAAAVLVFALTVVRVRRRRTAGAIGGEPSL